MPLLQSFVVSLSQSSGLPLNFVRNALMVLSALPFTAIYLAVPSGSKAARQWTSILLSSGLFLALFPVDGFLTILGTSLTVYCLSLYNRSSSLTPWICFLMPMAHLCIHQFGCQVGVPLGWLEPNTPDYGAILMILVIKLSNFAWACHDGGKDPSALSEDQRRYAIRENPDILDFFGYIFFYGGFFIGPAFEFTDYQDYINRRAPFDTMPSPIFPALANFVLSLTTFGLFMYAKPFQMFDWAVTKDFRTYNFVLRLLYFQLIGFFVRCQYYGGWKLTESACIMSGLGYNGRDPKDPQGKNHHFNRVENISIHEVELSENPRMMMESWNKNTASWLKRSIYTRFLDNQPGRLSAATYLTYFVSALWHGFRPGYYFCFLSASLMTLSGRALRKHIRPLFLQGTKLHPFKPVYDVLGWAGTIFLINYCTMPFVAQTLARSITAWASIAFLGHILMVSVLLVSRNRGLTRKIEAFGKSIQLADAQKKKE